MYISRSAERKKKNPEIAKKYAKTAYENRKKKLQLNKTHENSADSK
jgi:hypothetical protein